MKIINFLKSERFDKFCFYFCLIDLMFLPYFFLITTNYSVPLLILWFVFRFKTIKYKSNFPLIITMTILILLSTCISFIMYPQNVAGTNIYVYNIKSVFQFVSYFLYYIMFANYINNNDVNLKKPLLLLLIFATILSFLYFVDKNLFANLKIFWNSSDDFTNMFLAGEPYLQYRYNFIWTDPNNPGYFFVSLLFFLCLNIKTTLKEKVFVFLCTIIIVISTMSSGTLISLGIVSAILILDAIINNRKKVLEFIKNIKIVHLILFFVIIGIVGFLIFDNAIFDEFLQRVSNNSLSYRINIWFRIFKNTDLYKYILLGTGGTQVILKNLSLIYPHSGEIYLLYSFGLVCMLLFVYCFFRPNMSKNYKKFLFVLPVFIGFTINTIVGEQKFVLLYLLMYCFYQHEKKEKELCKNKYVNTNTDLVSIVVPIYNSEKYLKRCLDSLINQTHKNIEIILINDGSKDGSLKLCNNYAKKDERIKLFNNKNHGVSYSRNFGIEQANGKYIMFVDSDDYADINIVHDMLSLKSDDVDLIIGGLIMKDKNNQVISKHILKEGKYQFDNFIEKINKDLDFLCVCGPCCKLYDLDKIRSNQIKFDENLTMGEDTTFNIDYLSNSNIIVTMSNIYYHYMRENPNSLFTRYYDDFMYINDKVLKNFINMLILRNCSKQAIQNLKNIYFDIIFSSNNMNFKYKKLNTKEKRLEDIEYMFSLPFIQEVCLSNSKNLIHKLKFYFVKKKMKKTLYYLFLINNLIKE